MSTKAKYGPLRWPEGRPRDERSKLLTGADLVVAANERDSTGRHSKLGDCHWWPVEPWFLHHGISVEEGLKVIGWLGCGYSIDTATVHGLSALAQRAERSHESHRSGGRADELAPSHAGGRVQQGLDSAP